MIRERPDAGERLARALRGALQDFAGEVRIEGLTSIAWRSVTFSGARHHLRIRLEGVKAGAAADALLARMPEADFHLPDHVLADIASISDERDPDGSRVGLELEALTVEGSRRSAREVG